MPKLLRKRRERIVSLDTETTGLDLHHGARPFLVTTCDEDEVNTYWEWAVDPMTREVQVVADDLREINDVIARADILVLQNPKFDYHALRTVFTGKGGRPRLWWDWGKIRDTLTAGHLLNSNQPHDLTTMAMVYLKVNVQPYEDALEVAVKDAKKWAKANHPEWRLAKAGLEDMPSAKHKTWKYDSWLPRLVDPSSTVCEEYANSDSTVTLKLWLEQERRIKDLGLWPIYLETLKVLPSLCAMEDRGVTMSSERTKELNTQYTESSAKLHAKCVRLSGGEIEELPKNGASNALKHVLFDVFGLKPSRKTPKGNASVDKFVLDEWIATLPDGPPRQFVESLRGYRRRQTALGYIEIYKKFWLPFVDDYDDVGDLWKVLYPSVNPTGTATLRMSSSNPNEQQISKQGISEVLEDGTKTERSARYMFGPAPGREWWSLDAKNIELRIPAYEAGEQAMIDLFERPDDPPYFGSNHLLFFDILHPDLFAKHGAAVKKVFADTWYQWTKNGDFAVQYGAVAESGTADRAYHVPGAQAKIESHLRNIKRLSERWIKFAEKTGYVETMPDKTVDPNRGYPLRCTRTGYGRILPTVPLSYHVQGTAMWWMRKAMVRCHDFLKEYNRPRKPEARAYLIMQIHDEMVFDFPESNVDPTTIKDWKTDKFQYLRTNLPTIRKIQRLMEQGGDDIGVPTPVSVEYHPVCWSEGVSL